MFQRRGLRGGWGPGSPPPTGNRKNHSWDIRFQGKSEMPGGDSLPGSPIFFFKQNRFSEQRKGIELPRALSQPAFQRPFLAARALGFLPLIASIKATCVYLHIGILRPPVTRPRKASRREGAGSPRVRSGLYAEFGMGKNKIAPGTKEIWKATGATLSLREARQVSSSRLCGSAKRRKTAACAQQCGTLSPPGPML